MALALRDATATEEAHMRATDLLREQHRDIADLFREIDDTSNDEELSELCDLVGARLTAHDLIERDLFYPACKARFGDDAAFVDDSLVEHGLLLLCLNEVERADDRRFREAIDILHRVVEHHARQEERELFPRIEAAMLAADLDALGVAMERRFNRALTTDLRSTMQATLAVLSCGGFGAAGDGAPGSTTEA